MEKKYNMRSPAVKRLMREAIELKDATPMYYAQPLDDNLFEWHFTIQGPQSTEFEGGRYHGRILLPTEYPMKPPSIILMTPNGRFEIHQKICLTASAYHPEFWQPSWSIRTVLLAIVGFMPTEGVGAIGSMDCSPEDRKRMAARSLNWMCPTCQIPNRDILPQAAVGSSQEEAMSEAANIVTQMAFKSEEEVRAQKQELAKTGDTARHHQGPPVERGSSGTATEEEPKLLESVETVRAETVPNPSSPGGPGQSRDSESGSTDVGGGVRQRVQLTSSIPEGGRAMAGQSPRTSPGAVRGRGRRGGGGWGTLTLMWILLVAIGALLVRRLYFM